MTLKHKMQPGDLCTCDLSSWPVHIEHDRFRQFDRTKEIWHNKLCVYLGEEIIEPEANLKVVNHKFLVNGEIKVVDYHWIKFMVPYTYELG